MRHSRTPSRSEVQISPQAATGNIVQILPLTLQSCGDDPQKTRVALPTPAQIVQRTACCPNRMLTSADNMNNLL